MIEENQFNQEALKSHNKLRSLHNAPNLRLNKSLISDSQEWAKHMAEKSCLGHSQSQGKYGENIACSSNKLSGEDVTKLWYAEIKDYKFNQEKQQHDKIGHFSQVVWKNTSEVGFGLAKSNNGKWYFVARYLKPGNFIGNFMENVFPVSTGKSIPNNERTVKRSSIVKENSPLKNIIPKSLQIGKLNIDAEKNRTSKPNGISVNMTAQMKSMEINNMKFIKSHKKTYVKNGKEITEVTEIFVTKDGKEHVKTSTTEKRL